MWYSIFRDAFRKYVEGGLNQSTIGRLFSRATNFANGARKAVCGNYFHKTTLAELFTIHVNLHAMEFPLIFGETNFVEVPKIRKIYGPQKRAPYSIKILGGARSQNA